MEQVRYASCVSEGGDQCSFGVGTIYRYGVWVLKSGRGGARATCTWIVVAVIRPRRRRTVRWPLRADRDGAAADGTTGWVKLCACIL